MANNYKVMVRTNDHPTARHAVDLDAVESLMDSDLADAVAQKLGLKLDNQDEWQVFVDEYAAAHERVYGAPLIVN